MPNPRHEFATVSVALDEYDIIDKKIAFGYVLSEAEELAQKDRKKMPIGDFLFKDRTFPITKESSINDALHRWASSKHGLSYEEFVKKLHNHVKRTHPEWLGGFPEQTLKKFGIHSDKK